MEALEQHTITHVTLEELQNEFSETRARLQNNIDRGSFEQKARDERVRLQDRVSELTDMIIEKTVSR